MAEKRTPQGLVVGLFAEAPEKLAEGGKERKGRKPKAEEPTENASRQGENNTPPYGENE